MPSSNSKHSHPHLVIVVSRLFLVDGLAGILPLRPDRHQHDISALIRLSEGLHLASITQNDVGPSWMVVQKVRHIIHLTLNDDPTGFSSVVPRDLYSFQHGERIT